MNIRTLALPIALFLLPLAHARDVRTWTSASGKTMEAAFVDLRSDEVTLRTPAGETLRIRLNQLSGPDQIHARSLTPSAAAPGAGLRGAPAVEKEVPPALDELFGKRLVGLKGKRLSTADLAGKKIAIYFTASWCPPCRAFTPSLVQAYTQLQTDGKPFEVVLVSHDRDKASMERYMKDSDMPWVAMPFGDKRVEALKKKFSVSGIPKLVVIDDTGKTLSADARGEVSAKGAAAFDSW